MTLPQVVALFSNLQVTMEVGGRITASYGPSQLQEPVTTIYTQDTIFTEQGCRTLTGLKVDARGPLEHLC